jgi:hypothetical protein
MGRAMLFTATGAIIVFGLVQLGLFSQKSVLAEDTANYASDNHARNVAFTTIQLAMEKINQDPTWKPSEASPWESKVEGANTSLYYEVLSLGSGINDPDTIRVFSEASYFDQKASIISTFARQSLHFVPKFEAALSIATDQFNFSMSGSSSISGVERSGTCSDKPGVTVQDVLSHDEVVAGASADITDIQNGVVVDPNVKYSPVDELIARLATSPTAQTISGNYKGSLGTAADPGVFFVENYANLTGGLSAGYGILVIRSGGSLEYDGMLDVAGNFEFNGLIVFENAFDFKGRGTPSLNGSVLVGNTPNNNDVIDIDISGNLNLQYDCKAEEYAQRASAGLLKQNRYTRLNTFE